MTYLPNKRFVLACFIVILVLRLCVERDTHIWWSSVTDIANYNHHKYNHEETLSSSQHGSALPSRDSSDNDPEIIHIATSCSGGPYLITLTTFIKSLIFFRKNYIHFHIMTNSTTKFSIDTLLSTWSIKDFNFTTYVRPDKDPDFNWIPYSHGSGHFGFQKLIVPDILPTNIDKVIFYDVDIVLLNDISELWQEFSKFSSSQAIGMGYETQFWYNAGVKEAWPALKWGYNGGLLLLDLHKLRNIPFKDMYTKYTREMLERKHEAYLAEQDMLNYLFVRNPDILHTLPCVWNVQFGDRSNPDVCKIEETLDIKALHTTIPKLNRAKWDARLPVYKEIVDTFNKMNGNRFSTNPGKHRVFPFRGSTDSIKSSDVTLVIKMSSIDWKKFDSFLLKWKGFICLLIFGKDYSVEIMLELPVRDNVSYNFIYLKEGETTVQIPEVKKLLPTLVRTIRYIVAGTEDEIPSNALEDFHNNNKNGKWRDFVIENIKR